MTDTQTITRTPLLKVMGVQVSVTPNAWVYPLWTLAVGLTLAVILHGLGGIGSVLVIGMIYTGLLMLTYTLHTLGHIISAREVDAPMSEHIITAGIHLDVYNDDRTYPREIHTSRAIGGPLMNLTLAFIAFFVWAFVPGTAFLVFAGSNLVWGIVSLLPIRGFDGEVLWRGRVS